MKILAIIPSYNEKISILREVVTETKKYVDKVLVIDDGSKEKLKLGFKGITVLRNEPNKGKGYSLLRGLKYAVDNKYDVAITLDGDGEHRPYEISQFLKKIKKYDFVVGQRKSYRSFKRKFLNSFATFWFALLIPGIKDMYCGFRAIKIDSYKKMNLQGSGFELEPEMLLESVKNNISIGYVNNETTPLNKTNLKAEDYLRTNELYDRWILRNHRSLRVNFIKKSFLRFSAHTGLFITKIIKWNQV